MCYLVGRGVKNNFYVEPTYFPPEHTQNLSLHNGEETGQGKFDSKMTKSTWAKSSCLFFFFFLFFSYVFQSNVAFLFLIFFFLLISRCGALFLFFFLMVCSATLPPLFFSFDFLGVALCVCVSFCLTRNDFFFFLNLGDF